ncbi:hypothetical protein BGZ82_011378 [Podila clonocystis]|nr:hypothetical protein BGZ82_011378 [Podila clonocystis]
MDTTSSTTSTAAPGDADTTMKESSLSSPTPNDTKPTSTSTPSDTTTTPRPEKRRLANNGEDTRRNKRMMGMILGTLAQSKRATPLPSTATTAAGTTPGTGVQAGMTSREALQARVREKLEREKKLYQEQEAQERAERQKLWAERNEQRQRQREVVLQSRRAALDEVTKSGVARGRLPTTRDTRAPRWTGTDYILTETKPRLRYLPKVLNAATKEKLEAQSSERALDRERERGRIRERAPVDPRKEDSKELKDEKESETETKESKTESEATAKTTEPETGTGDEKPESIAKDEKLETMDLDSGLVVDVQASSADEKTKKEEDKSTEASTFSSESTAPVPEAMDTKDDEDVDMEPKKDNQPGLINISLV